MTINNSIITPFITLSHTKSIVLKVCHCCPPLSGYSNPRRMSERDIPSRISHEQELQMRAHRSAANAANAGQPLPAQPRIQGSKSVPTLNEDGPIAAANGQPLQPRRPQEIPPPYSVAGGHPQYNSMPKSMPDYNAQHMNNSRNYAPHPMTNYNTIGSYSPSRPDSQMSIHSQQRMSSSQSQQLYPEERHYQNIQLYQIQPTQQKTSSNAVPQRMHHSSHTSLQNDGPNPNYGQQNQRPLSALIPNKDDPYLSQKSAHSPGTPTSPRPPLAINPNMTAPDQFHYPQQYSNNRQSAQEFTDPQMMDYPARNYPPPHPPFIDPRQRDIIRQEAKMDEMREEVERRRQMGPPMPPSQRMSAPNGQWSQRPQYYPQQPIPGMNGSSNLRMGPPPAPKPRPTAAQTLSNNPYNQSYMRNSYREPHEPLPQTPANPPPPTVSYRYGPSGYPPSRQTEPTRTSNNPAKAQFNDAINSNNSRVSNADPRKSSGALSPSPWEREEKERVINICHLFSLQFSTILCLIAFSHFASISWNFSKSLSEY